MENNKFPVFTETESDKKEKKETTGIMVVSVLIFFLIAIFVCIKCYVAVNFAYYPIRGLSMAPTANAGAPSDTVQDGVIIQKNATFTYGDIVIIKLETMENTIIKRVIAKEGDKVCIRKESGGEYDGYYHVSVIYKDSNEIEVLQEDYINGYVNWTNAINSTFYNNVQYESYFYNKYISQGKNISLESDGAYYYEIGEGQLFFLGDNRQISLDARRLGTTKYENVVGVARVIIPYAGQIKDNFQLWWVQTKAYFGYFWQQINNFFAWNY